MSLTELLQKIKFYTTLSLGLIACLSCFLFFFMISFVIDPSVSTLMADFIDKPVVCRTVLMEYTEGSENCSWSSCKEGCTFEQYKCNQIYVDYMDLSFDDYDGNEYYNESLWAVKEVPIFVNIKQCGYPPHTNCTIFADEYGIIDTVFPCYYSRKQPMLVIVNYSWTGAVHPLILALIVPNLITGLSLGLLSYWWYPGCQKKNNYQVPPDQEDECSDEIKENMSMDGSRSDASSLVVKEKRLHEVTVDLMPTDVCETKDAKTQPEK